MGRRNHNWDPHLTTRDSDGTMVSRCKNCAMTERSDFYSSNGRVYAVLQWATPDGKLLAVRPVVDRQAPKTAPPLDGAFPGVEVTGMPECPKTPQGWPVDSLRIERPFGLVDVTIVIGQPKSDQGRG